MTDHPEHQTTPAPEFFNQYDSFESITLADNACGPTVVAMAINRANRLQNLPDRVSPFQILWQNGQMTKLPNYNSQYKLSMIGPEGNPGLIPVGHRISQSLRDSITQDKSRGIYINLVSSLSSNKEYIPTYTVMGGWDHRGSESFFKEYGISARQFGDKYGEKFSFNLLSSLIENGNLIMASTTNTKDSSHLVLISDYHEDGGGEFLVNDPKENKARWINAKDWYDSDFRGYGTVVYNDKTRGKYDH